METRKSTPDGSSERLPYVAIFGHHAPPLWLRRGIRRYLEFGQEPKSLREHCVAFWWATLHYHDTCFSHILLAKVSRKF